MNARILITCAGGTMIPALLAHLRTDPILNAYLVAVDASTAASGRFYADAFYQVPWASESNYVEKIANIVKQEKIDIVLPASDNESFRLSAGRDEIEAAGAKVLASPMSVLDLIRDKWATYRTLKSAGIHVPDYVCTDNFETLKKALVDFGYPQKSVIVKPIAERGGRGMRVLVGKEEIAESWIGTGERERRIDIPPTTEEIQGWFSYGTLMLMPLLHAPAYDVDIFAVNGNSKAALVRKRSNPAGIPFTGNTIISDSEIMQYCLDIAKALKLNALHDIDLMTDSNGRPCLLEVNPRPSGSVVASHAAGFPIVAAAIAESLGKSYPLSIPEEDIEIGMAPCAIKMVNNTTL